jgi:putative sigma-54 modulation protein
MPNENAEINLSVTFRHTDSTDALKQYASDKLIPCIRKYVKAQTDVHVILSVKKRDHLAEVNLHSKGYDISAKATTEDLYSAIDKVMHTLDVQLRKQKERTIDSKHAAPSP